MPASALDDLSRSVDRLTREIEAKRRAIAADRAAIQQARARCRRALDQLGIDLDGRPLPLGPLVWALIGGVASLTALFLTYLTGLLTLQYSRPDSDARVVMIYDVVAVALAGLTLVYSLKPGAGGSARAVLRPMTYVSIGVCVVALAAICLIRRPW